MAALILALARHQELTSCQLSGQEGRVAPKSTKLLASAFVYSDESRLSLHLVHSVLYPLRKRARRLDRGLSTGELVGTRSSWLDEFLGLSKSSHLAIER